MIFLDSTYFYLSLSRSSNFLPIHSGFLVHYLVFDFQMVMVMAHFGIVAPLMSSIRLTSVIYYRDELLGEVSHLNKIPVAPFSSENKHSRKTVAITSQRNSHRISLSLSGSLEVGYQSFCCGRREHTVQGDFATHGLSSRPTTTAKEGKGAWATVQESQQLVKETDIEK